MGEGQREKEIEDPQADPPPNAEPVRSSIPGPQDLDLS